MTDAGRRSPARTHPARALSRTLPPRRRDVLAGAGAFAAAALLPALPVQAGRRSHGLSFFGDLKYGPDFTHFDYANPDAPKGGTLVTQVPSWLYNQNPATFNTLNGFVLMGDGAAGIQLVFATLMSGGSYWRGGSLDEPDALYGYAASEVEVSDDGRVYRFFLRPEATFHDGSPITAEDVVFSIGILRDEGHPTLSVELKAVEEAVAEDARTLRVVFAEGAARNLPLTVAGGVPILSRAWWAGRDFSATLSEAPLGSGPYRVGAFSFGRAITYERVADHFGAALPVMRGLCNFDRIRLEFFRDRTAGFEAFKKGVVTFREEFSSKFWATAYDFPALTDGRVLRDEVFDGTPAGGQGWYFNTRRKKFADPRVREALAMAFDFEWTNANIMYSSYRRTTSFFENSPQKAEGPPSPSEIALLEPFRDRLPEAVFGEALLPPVSDGSGRDRRQLGRAQALLKEAGLVREGERWIGPDGEPLTVEFLDDDSSFEPHHASFINSLRLLGVPATYRVVDPAQLNARMRDFDFDVTISRVSMPQYPDSVLRQFFGSASAKSPGSYNLSGVADEVVDALIETVIAAATKEEFEAANRALDRVLRAKFLWVPQWYKATHWFAFWDVFGRPETQPPYGAAVFEAWWVDKDKAERLGRGT